MPDEPDETTITRYLLGTLGDAEIERLDELSVADDRFADRLRAAENDLVDAFARRDLSGEDLESFRTHYLSSPRRRDKVRFAEAFLSFNPETAIAQDKEALHSVPESREPRRSVPSEPFWSLSKMPRQGWAVAAAVLVLLAWGGYHALENRRLRSQVAGAQAERAALQQREKELERELEENRSEGAKTAGELAAVRERLAQIEQQSQAGQKGKPEPEVTPVLAFTLAPPTRGAGSIPTVAIPARTGVIALQLELETDAFPAYQTTLKIPATSQTLWRSGRIRPARKGQAKVISLKLRTNLLEPGIYHAELEGIQPGKAGEVIATYPFRVVIQ